jgi:putative transposase
MSLCSSAPPGHRALRAHRVSTPGRAYFVTFVTHGRARRFADDRCAACACRALVDARSWRQSLLLAWVLMPDHWHGLVRLGPGDDLSRLVNRLKSNSSRRVRCETGLDAKLWADGFHDRALRRGEGMMIAVRYIVLNPVRAGLVGCVRGYPYWAVMGGALASGLAALLPGEGRDFGQG